MKLSLHGLSLSHFRGYHFLPKGDPKFTKSMTPTGTAPIHLTLNSLKLSRLFSYCIDYRDLAG